jgi:hypothetical protein
MNIKYFSYEQDKHLNTKKGKALFQKYTGAVRAIFLILLFLFDLFLFYRYSFGGIKKPAWRPA